MRKFLYTHEKIDGQILFGFNNETEKIVLIDVSGAALNDEQFDWVFRHIPSNIRSMKGVYGREGSKIEEVLQSPPSFSDFWTAYFKNRQKDNSSKKKSEIKWNKISSAQQMAAFNYIQKYMSNVPNGTVPKLAETYLNCEVWEQ
jgi:hypothetical protein